MKRFPWMLWAAAAGAQAHEGHGLPGPAHWHATDAWGLLALLAAAGAALWWTRRQ